MKRKTFKRTLPFDPCLSTPAPQPTSPFAPQKQTPKQNPQNNVRHLWQIGTAVITFKYYNTQKQHTALRKKHQDFKSVLFLLEKKNTKHTHFKKHFFICFATDVIPYFQRQFNSYFYEFFCKLFFFVCMCFSRGGGFYFSPSLLFFLSFLRSKLQCRHCRLWWIQQICISLMLEVPNTK